MQIWQLCVCLPGQIVTCLSFACCVRSSFLHSGHISGFAKTERKLIGQNNYKNRISFPYTYWKFKQLVILLRPIAPIICRIKYWLWSSRYIYIKGRKLHQERFLVGSKSNLHCEVKPSRNGYMKNIRDDKHWWIGHFRNLDIYDFLPMDRPKPQPMPEQQAFLLHIFISFCLTNWNLEWNWSFFFFLNFLQQIYI